MNYWDLTERERSELTFEDVQQFVDFELMQKGVLRATPPGEAPKPTATVKQTEFFVVSANTGAYGRERVLFRTREQAEAFSGSGACCRASAYVDGKSIEYVAPFDGPIETLLVYTAEDYQAFRSQLERDAAEQAKYEAKRTEYEKACKAQSAALSGLWEDHSRCRTLGEELSRVRDTYQEYVKLAGSPELAAKFLWKVFEQDKIAEANVWFGLTIALRDITEPDRGAA